MRYPFPPPTSKVAGTESEPTSDPLVPSGGSATREAYAIVETSAVWPPAWTPRPEIQLITARRGIGRDAGICTMVRRYGPGIYRDGAVVSQLALRLAGHWVQVRLMGRGPSIIIWSGRISEETDTPFGQSELAAGSGTQQFVAYGPLRILERANYSTSIWRTGVHTPLQEVGWLPGFNAPSQSGLTGAVSVVGNRSSARETDIGCYVFGGDERWSAFDALEYTLRNHSDKFVIGGQLNALRQIKDYIPTGTTDNIADVLSRIIPERFGLSWLIADRIANGSVVGWELRVISTLTYPGSFGDVTVPSESVANLDLMGRRDVEFTVTRSTAQRYRRIRAVGERVVSCFSIGPQSQTGGSAYPGWSSALRNQYAAATDAARQQDAFRDVYQVLRVPDGWQFQGGAANPVIAATGAPTIDLVNQPSNQPKIRRTLRSLPMVEQYDYSTIPPTLRDGASEPTYQADFVPPLVTALAFGVHIPIDRLGVVGNAAESSVAALESDWGVRLRTRQAAHALALMDASLYATSAFVPTAANSVRWTECNFTIAVELDQRLSIEYTQPNLPGIEIEQDDGTLVVHVPDAHFWILAPRTIVDARGSAGLVFSPNEISVLRDDRQALAYALAGAVSKLQREQVAAVVAIRELGAYGYILGKVLSEQYTLDRVTLERVQITAVEWDFTAMTTVLYAGGAR